MQSEQFVDRHNGICPNDMSKMLKTIGVNSLDELIGQTIPADIRLTKKLQLPAPMSEHEYADHIHELSLKNQLFTNYIGMGLLRHCYSGCDLEKTCSRILYGTLHTLLIRLKFRKEGLRHYSIFKQ